ncbi:SGNH/GDSL hydrolase family protein [Coraliomargarita sinensis]|uniref:SGNH/GDSL hydrolase family protein n=1 Tax=Coraliomargarita sinensis TaxID=2174842 RepID=A0A317ZD80_9BACT|nr:SGNH/GDSL hydrolase family protein [Coraliomargarita sinensis]PXA03205.1 SGNH/GDSL hydrolase family protein [Coraliomargarita sinensis]
MRFSIFVISIFALLGPAAADSFYTPERDKYRVEAAEENETEERLPKVLLIGDSIMGGYFKQTKDFLQDEVQVLRHPGNAGETRNGLKKIEDWLGETEWDLIHFNWGLHDLCYRHPESKVYGKRDKIRGTLSVPLEEYKENLEKLVQRLKETDATLIFATTTKIPEGEAGRFVGDDAKYNEAALEVMKRYGVAVNDLYRISKDFGPEMYVAPRDVHHTGKGNKVLAEAVADAIRKQLD